MTLLKVSHHAGVSSELDGQRGSVLLNDGMYPLSKVKADRQGLGEWITGRWTGDDKTPERRRHDDGRMTRRLLRSAYSQLSQIRIYFAILCELLFSNYFTVVPKSAITSTVLQAAFCPHSVSSSSLK